MNYRKLKYLGLLLFVFAVVILLIAGSGQASAKPKDPPDSKCAGNNGQGNGKGKCPKITHADREAAAARALQQGALNPLMVDALV